MKLSKLALYGIISVPVAADKIKVNHVHKNLIRRDQMSAGGGNDICPTDVMFVEDFEEYLDGVPEIMKFDIMKALAPFYAAMQQVSSKNLSIGSNTQMIPEASDASRVGITPMDGMSGDTNFPHGKIKPIATVGEFSMCIASEGEAIVGVPDGMGAYLKDDATVRVIVQSESYGPITEGTLMKRESYPMFVNNGFVSFTGSHIQFVDYDREMFSKFMKDSSSPASNMVTGFGEVVQYAYNLKGEAVMTRNKTGPTSTGAHYSNTDAAGNYAVSATPTLADWLLQSLCSAHLIQKHQWTKDFGLVDDIFLTNEEWITLKADTDFVGLSAHAINLAKSSMHAVGAFTLGGFEKIAEINPLHKDYVIFAVSGYNGDFGSYPQIIAKRNAAYQRKDGKPFVRPRHTHPARIYIGKKGYMENGSIAPADDFLARNGLRYGQVYGFAVDMSVTGPTSGKWRDVYHDGAVNGAFVPGLWLPIKWRWDGIVRNFEHDGSWDFQDAPMNQPNANYMFWNAAGNDAGGAKTEHATPDLRAGFTGFVQGSTGGYFGHYYLKDTWKNMAGDFPSSVSAEYYVYQGRNDVRNQIMLGGKGLYADGKDAKTNYAGGNTYTRFDSVDGLELFMGDKGKMYLGIQEDSGNWYGERMFLSSPLEHKMDGKELTYYFVAMSGGKKNTRMMHPVGIPAGVNNHPDGHEFSGWFDLSGLLYKSKSGFFLSYTDEGYVKRQADSQVSINNKYLLLGLQAHNFDAGLISTFALDRGGQWLVYQPSI